MHSLETIILELQVINIGKILNRLGQIWIQFTSSKK